MHFYMHTMGVSGGNPTSLVVSEQNCNQSGERFPMKRSLHTEEGNVHKIIDE